MSDLALPIPADATGDATTQYLMTFNTQELDLIPATQETAISYIQAWDTSRKKMAETVWWFRKDNHFTLLYPDLSFKAFCKQVLHITYQYANAIYALVEINRGLPEYLRLTSTRQARAVLDIPQDHRLPVLEEAFQTRPTNGSGHKTNSERHIRATWRIMFPDDQTSPDAILDEEDAVTLEGGDAPANPPRIASGSPSQRMTTGEVRSVLCRLVELTDQYSREYDHITPTQFVDILRHELSFLIGS